MALSKRGEHTVGRLKVKSRERWISATAPASLRSEAVCPLQDTWGCLRPREVQAPSDATR